MKNREWIHNLLLLVIAVVMTSCMRAPHSLNLAQLPPATINGWQPAEADKTYNAETLYKYIDGGAELYRSFNVQTVLARRYAKENAPDIIVDLFDMGSANDAFGVYHHTIREEADAGIGQDSEFIGATLLFWKGQYYVSILAFEETEEAKRTVRTIGELIAERIPEHGTPPSLFQMLPEDAGQVKERHYFHDHFVLNRYYYFADENLFQLARETEGVLVRYQVKPPPTGQSEGASFVVLLIRYKSPEAAEKALQNFLSIYLPDADSEGIAKTEDGKWAAAQSLGTFIMGVFDSPSKEKTLWLMNELNKSLMSKSQEQKEVQQ